MNANHCRIAASVAAFVHAQGTHLGFLRLLFTEVDGGDMGRE